MEEEAKEGHLNFMGNSIHKIDPIRQGGAEGCWNQIFFPRVYCAEGAKTIFCYSDFHARSRFFKDPLKL